MSFINTQYTIYPKITQLNELYKHPITQKLPSLMSFIKTQLPNNSQIQDHKHPKKTAIRIRKIIKHLGGFGSMKLQHSKS